MKNCSPRIACLSKFTALLFAIPIAASGAPYVYDGFSSSEYTVAGSPVGVNGGTGFGSAWSFGSTGSGASTEIVGGLSLTGLVSTGNAVLVSANENGGTVTGTLGREFGNTTPANSDLWGSYLIQQTAQTVPNGFAGEFAISGSKFQPGADRQFFTNPKSSQGFDSTFNADIGIYKDPTAQDLSFDLTLDNTFMVVMAFENINFGAFTGNTTTATLWILNQADVTAIGSSVTRSALDANNRTTITGSVTPEFGTGGLVSANPFDFFAQQGSVIFDEVRLGTTLADVYVVPEPSSILLSLGGLLAVSLLRRRRRPATI